MILWQSNHGCKTLSFFKESELLPKELDAAFTGSSAWKINASLDINTKRKLEETTFKVFLYGSSDAVQTIRYDQLFSETNRMLRAIVDANKTSPLELGAPISYSLKFLNQDTQVATNCNAKRNFKSSLCAWILTFLWNLP